MSKTNLDKAVDEAVQNAQDTYNEGEGHPLDHGFAHMEIDGRTALANAFSAHPDIEAETYDYVTVDGLSRYLTPQREGYRAFVDTLEAHGIETDSILIRGRLD